MEHEAGPEVVARPAGALEAEEEGEIIYQIQEDGEINIVRDKRRRMGRDKLRRRERILLKL